MLFKTVPFKDIEHYMTLPSALYIDYHINITGAALQLNSALLHARLPCFCLLSVSVNSQVALIDNQQ